MMSDTVAGRRRVWFSLCAVLVMLSGKDLLGQNCTPANSPPMLDHGWSKGRSVSVYIDNTMTTAQYDAIALAFNNWNSVNGSTGNNSQITYTFTSSEAGADFTVLHVTPTANVGVRAETAVAIDALDHTVHAATSLSPTETDPAVLTEIMVHEIGHTAGLDDCPSCSTSDSVMSHGAPPGNILVGRPTTPTACDNSNVHGNYPTCTPPVFSCNSYDANTCTCSDVGGSGGGGGGEVYDKDGISCMDWYLVTWVSHDGGVTWHFSSEVYLGCW